jgi:glycosyltransferase involved in cell wall biosynthesis
MDKKVSDQLVSICIPTYKMPHFLTRCLESIFKQTYKNVEVIVSDDSPGEDIKAVVDSYNHLLTIRYFKNIPALKSPANWNHALDMAKGKYYMLMHQDDWFAHEQSINNFVRILQTESTDFAFCQNIAVDEKNHLISLQKAESLPNLNEDYSKLILVNVIGPPSNVMLQKRVTERYHVNFVWLVDIEYYMRLLQNGYRYSYINSHQVNIGLHKDQTTVFCMQHPDIIIRENIHIAAGLLSGEFKKIAIFDYYWRFLRNNHIRSREDLLANGLAAGEIPDVICKMVEYQKKIPANVLKNGVVSKLSMLTCYLF